MARISSIFLAALGAVRPALAFTNGSLIPSYFCNPNPDGLPKSLGELIPFTVKDMGEDLAFNKNVTDNLKKVPVTNSQPGNTGYMLASFHNTLNSIAPIIPGINVELANGQTSLIAGQANQLVLKSLVAGKDVLGILIHAVFVGTHTPAGFFSDSGKIFVPFPGCGLASTGEFNGLVHRTTICQQTYSGLSYHAPAFSPGTSILILGLSVTDYGFGVWNLTAPLVAATNSPIPRMPTSMTPTHPATTMHATTPSMSHPTISSKRMSTMNTTKATTSMAHMSTMNTRPTSSMPHMSVMSIPMANSTKASNTTGLRVTSGAGGRPRSLLRFWWR